MKAEAREVMREKIDFGQALTDIGKMENTLAELIKGETEISNARIGAIRKFLDSKWKRIDRVLPPLKALEISGDNGGALIVQTVKYADDSDSG